MVFFFNWFPSCLQAAVFTFVVNSLNLQNNIVYELTVIFKMRSRSAYFTYAASETPLKKFIRGSKNLSTIKALFIYLFSAQKNEIRYTQFNRIKSLLSTEMFRHLRINNLKK